VSVANSRFLPRLVGILFEHKVYSRILQVAEEIWVCENGTVTKWQGDIQTYKDHLKEKIVKDKASSKKQFK
jgi:ATP-binding cassette subfamily F protein 2